MSDIFSKDKRHEIMSSVSGKDTKPEILVRKCLFAQGFRFRKNVKRLPGTPDIVLPKYKTIIFVHGCFWHGHSDCVNARLPKSNIEYWTKKISSNMIRDEKNVSKLTKMGYKIIVIWTCELSKKNIQQTIGKTIQMILDA